MKWWAGAFERSCADQRADLCQVAAWASLPPPPEQAWLRGSTEQFQRLEELRERLARLDQVPTLRTVAALQQSLLPSIDAILEDLARQTHTAGDDRASVTDWFGQLRRAIVDSSQHAAARIKEVEHLAQQCQELADMDFSFLFDKSRDLFAIGYNVGDHRLDNSFYDLLASEARLAAS